MKLAQGGNAGTLEGQQQQQALIVQQKANQQELLNEQQTALWTKGSEQEAEIAFMHQCHEGQLAALVTVDTEEDAMVDTET